MDVRPEKVDIRKFIDGVSFKAREPIEAGENAFTIDCPDDIGELVTDPVLLEQVLADLLDNAGKFTREGRVTLGARRLPGNGLAVSVADTGPGMPAEQVELLMQPFAQAAPLMTRSHGGAGLGLAIGVRLCQVLGGRMAVESAAGGGTTITVHLPAGL